MSDDWITCPTCDGYGKVEPGSDTTSAPDLRAALEHLDAALGDARSKTQDESTYSALFAIQRDVLRLHRALTGSAPEPAPAEPAGLLVEQNGGLVPAESASVTATTRVVFGAPASEPTEDRSEPPPGDVVWLDESSDYAAYHTWDWDTRDHFNRPDVRTRAEAIAACWAHRDRITAPLRAELADARQAIEVWQRDAGSAYAREDEQRARAEAAESALAAANARLNDPLWQKIDALAARVVAGCKSYEELEATLATVTAERDGARREMAERASATPMDNGAVLYHADAGKAWARKRWGAEEAERLWPAAPTQESDP